MIEWIQCRHLSNLIFIGNYIFFCRQFTSIIQRCNLLQLVCNLMSFVLLRHLDKVVNARRENHVWRENKSSIQV
jgi:hypothetical protein